MTFENDIHYLIHSMGGMFSAYLLWRLKTKKPVRYSASVTPATNSTNNMFSQIMARALNPKSLLHGLAVAVLTSVLTSLTAIVNNGTLPTVPQLKMIAIGSLGAGLAYVGKNLFLGSSLPPSIIQSQQGKPSMAITEGLNKTASDGINNPMNIRNNAHNAWVGKITSEGNKFEQFSFMWQGFRAGMIILRNLYAEGKTSLNELIATYAPAADGTNPEEYAATVAEAVGIDPADSLQPYINDKQTLCNIAAAMSKVEQGDGFIPNPDDLAQAWAAL